MKFYFWLATVSGWVGILLESPEVAGSFLAAACVIAALRERNLP